MVIEHLGTNHADEITLSPETNAHDTFPLTAGNGAIPHNTIQPLTDNLIEAALGSMANCTRKPDGSFSAVIPSSTIPASLHCSFLRRHQTIFTLSCEVSPSIPKRKWGEGIYLCHEYHVTQPFGRFFLRPSNAEETQVTLCFDVHLDAGDGVTVAFLRTFIISHLCGACAFLTEPHVQKLLVSTHTTKQRKTNNRKAIAEVNSQS
jgi:hypothetical protein